MVKKNGMPCSKCDMSKQVKKIHFISFPVSSVQHISGTGEGRAGGPHIDAVRTADVGLMADEHQHGNGKGKLNDVEFF